MARFVESSASCPSWPATAARWSGSSTDSRRRCDDGAAAPSPDAREPRGGLRVAATSPPWRRLLAADVGGEPARLLYDALAPWAHLFIVDGIGAAFFGSVRVALGQLASLVGEYDAAAGHFTGHSPRTPRSRRPPGRQRPAGPTPSMLERRGAPGDDAARGPARGVPGVLPSRRDRRTRRRARGGARPVPATVPDRRRAASCAARARSGPCRGGDTRRCCRPSRGSPTWPCCWDSRTVRSTCSTSSAHRAGGGGGR